MKVGGVQGKLGRGMYGGLLVVLCISCLVKTCQHILFCTEHFVNVQEASNVTQPRHDGHSWLGKAKEGESKTLIPSKTAPTTQRKMRLLNQSVCPPPHQPQGVVDLDSSEDEEEGERQWSVEEGRRRRKRRRNQRAWRRKWV